MLIASKYSSKIPNPMVELYPKSKWLGLDLGSLPKLFVSARHTCLDV
jgi:hypothetical protein